MQLWLINGGYESWTDKSGVATTRRRCSFTTADNVRQCVYHWIVVDQTDESHSQLHSRPISHLMWPRQTCLMWLEVWSAGGGNVIECPLKDVGVARKRYPQLRERQSFALTPGHSGAFHW